VSNFSMAPWVKHIKKCEKKNACMSLSVNACSHLHKCITPACTAVTLKTYAKIIEIKNFKFKIKCS
jgi:hypothetical protein